MDEETEERYPNMNMGLMGYDALEGNPLSTETDPGFRNAPSSFWHAMSQNGFETQRFYRSQIFEGSEDGLNKEGSIHSGISVFGLDQCQAAMHSKSTTNYKGFVDAQDFMNTHGTRTPYECKPVVPCYMILFSFTQVHPFKLEEKQLSQLVECPFPVSMRGQLASARNCNRCSKRPAWMLTGRGRWEPISRLAHLPWCILRSVDQLQKKETV